MVVGAAARRFTIEEYYRMGEAGILGEDDRVELIQGQIIEMSPIGDPHIWCVDCLTYFFSALRGRAILRVQSPIRLPDDSAPQPDIVLLRWRAGLYPPGRPPAPEDILLIVEVAGTSLSYDRGTKLPLYARAGIPETWIIDLQGRAVIVAREPSPDGYRHLRTLQGDEPLAPLAFPDLQLTPQDVLPPQ